MTSSTVDIKNPKKKVVHNIQKEILCFKRRFFFKISLLSSSYELKCDKDQIKI